MVPQGKQKVDKQCSHYSSVYIVCPTALKPIPLDFSGHFQSSNEIKSVKNIHQKVIVACKIKVVANKLKIFNFSLNCNLYGTQCISVSS
jgi:hypothetical protein